MFGCDIPDLNIPPMFIDDSPYSKKRSLYNSYPPPATIDVAFIKSAITLTLPWDHLPINFRSYYIPAMYHNIMRDRYVYEKPEIG